MEDKEGENFEKQQNRGKVREEECEGNEVENEKGKNDRNVGEERGERNVKDCKVWEER